MRSIWSVHLTNLILLLAIPSISQAQSTDQKNTSVDDLSHTHIFGGDINIQGMHQQYSLANARGPLPFGITGSVQKWVSGPPLANLYTQIAQGYAPLNDKVKLVFNEIYQKQGNIALTNLVTGISYKANSDLSINVTAGAGTNPQNTYRYSFYFSPQYKLPFESDGQKTTSIEAGLTYQNFALGEFAQISPKVNWHVSALLPVLSAGYSFGNFKNSSSQVTNGYYPPKTLSGAMFTGVLRPSQNSFLALTWYPANLNNIAGIEVIQDTFGATLHYNWSPQFRSSLFSQFQVTRGSGNNVALGASASFNF